MLQNKLQVAGVAYSDQGLGKNSGNQLMHLLNLVESINRLSDLDEIGAKICEGVQSLMNVQTSILLLCDEDNQNLCVEYCTGPLKNEIIGQCVSLDDEFCGWAAKHRMPLIANNIGESPEINATYRSCLNENFGIKNIICVPLLGKNKKLLAVIEAINRYDSHQIIDDDISLLQIFATHAAMAIERAQHTQKQRDRLREQDMYLTEIHHRVKNDLALISGIVEIESLEMENEDAQRVLQSIQSRIKSMAVVYELLSGKGSNTQAEVGTYFKKLVEGISSGLKERDKQIDIQIQTDNIIIDPYKALSCGLILNELLLNSYKYAFQDRPNGAIEIRLIKQDKKIVIDYSDDGPGYPEGFELENQDSVGFTMMKALVDHLNGTLEIVQENGAHVRLKFEAESDIDEIKPISEKIRA